MASEANKNIGNEVNQLFVDVAKGLKNLEFEELKQKCITFILQGTPHKDIAKYHNDFDISIVEKSKRYAWVLGMIDYWSKELQEGLFQSYGKKDAVIAAKASSSGAATNEFADLEHTITVQAKKIAELEAANKGVTKQFLQEKETNVSLMEEMKKEREQKHKVIQIVSSTGEVIVDLGQERHHKQLQELFDILSARNSRGLPEFLWVDGAPGAGKTFLGKTLAKMLGVKFYVRPADPTVTSNKLLGFSNLLTGDFKQGWFYTPYKEGGLLCIDEGDLMDASCFAGTNSIENEEFMFDNGEMVSRHKDFYFMVFANTRGQGAVKGFQRNKLDAATMDRFTVVELEYDNELEQQIFNNDRWAKHIQKIREWAAKNTQGSLYITPRATRKGAALLAQGKLSPERIEDITIYRFATADTKANSIKANGRFQVGVTIDPISGNPLFTGKNIEPKDEKQILQMKPSDAWYFIRHTNPVDKGSQTKRLKWYIENRFKQKVQGATCQALIEAPGEVSKYIMSQLDGCAKLPTELSLTTINHIYNFNFAHPIENIP